MAISTAFDPSDRARGVAIKTVFKDLRQDSVLLLPQRIALVGQGATDVVYTEDKLQVSSAKEVGDNYGYGSPLHLAAKELFPESGTDVGRIPVTVYPLLDSTSPAGAAATGKITITGTFPLTADAQVYFKVGNFTSLVAELETGDDEPTVAGKVAAAINGVIDMPLKAVVNVNDVDWNMKWKGTTGNQILITETVYSGTETVFVLSDNQDGANDPSTSPATAQFQNTWETLVLACFNHDTVVGAGPTTVLDELNAVGETRWGPLVRKPYMAFVGAKIDNIATAETAGNLRKTDRINVMLNDPGGSDLPWQIAARMLVPIARQANVNPPHDYGGLAYRGTTDGTKEWNYALRDRALKAGVSTVQIRNNVPELSDIVTFYHPDGEVNPAWRYVVDAIKVMNIVYNLNLIFDNNEWNGAPLLPDNQPTSNRSAKKPKFAKAAVAAMLDGLGLEAIISDVETAKENILVEIDSGNPKRLNISLTVAISGNVNMIAIDLNFGFFFGSPQVFG